MKVLFITTLSLLSILVWAQNQDIQKLEKIKEQIETQRKLLYDSLQKINERIDFLKVQEIREDGLSERATLKSMVVVYDTPSMDANSLFVSNKDVIVKGYIYNKSSLKRFWEVEYLGKIKYVLDIESNIPYTPNMVEFKKYVFEKNGDQYINGRKSHTTPKTTVIGNWNFSAGNVKWSVTIYKVANKYKLKSVHNDGSSGVIDVIFSMVNGKSKFTKPNSDDGDFFIIESDGNLGSYDNMGFIRKGKKV